MPAIGEHGVSHTAYKVVFQATFPTLLCEARVIEIDDETYQVQMIDHPEGEVHTFDSQFEDYETAAVNAARAGYEFVRELRHSGRILHPMIVSE